MKRYKNKLLENLSKDFIKSKEKYQEDKLTVQLSIDYHNCKYHDSEYLKLDISKYLPNQSSYSYSKFDELLNEFNVKCFVTPDLSSAKIIHKLELFDWQLNGVIKYWNYDLSGSPFASYGFELIRK